MAGVHLTSPSHVTSRPETGEHHPIAATPNRNETERMRVTTAVIDRADMSAAIDGIHERAEARDTSNLDQRDPNYLRPHPPRLGDSFTEAVTPVIRGIGGFMPAINPAELVATADRLRNQLNANSSHHAQEIDARDRQIVALREQVDNLAETNRSLVRQISERALSTVVDL